MKHFSDQSEPPRCVLDCLTCRSHFWREHALLNPTCQQYKGFNSHNRPRVISRPPSLLNRRRFVPAKGRASVLPGVPILCPLAKPPSLKDDLPGTIEGCLSGSTPASFKKEDPITSNHLSSVGAQPALLQRKRPLLEFTEKIPTVKEKTAAEEGVHDSLVDSGVGAADGRFPTQSVHRTSASWTDEITRKVQEKRKTASFSIPNGIEGETNHSRALASGDNIGVYLSKESGRKQSQSKKGERKEFQPQLEIFELFQRVGDLSYKIDHSKTRRSYSAGDNTRNESKQRQDAADYEKINIAATAIADPNYLVRSHSAVGGRTSKSSSLDGFCTVETAIDDGIDVSTVLKDPLGLSLFRR